MKRTQTHAAALDDLLRWRRDDWRFRPDPIEADILERLRCQMDRALSVGNSRPWRVMQVEDPAQRARIVARFEACNRRAAEDCAPDPQRDDLDPKLAGLREAPVHLAVFTDMAVQEGRGLGRQTMPEVLAYSTEMAIHTLWIAAQAENVEGMGVLIAGPAWDPASVRGVQTEI